MKRRAFLKGMALALLAPGMLLGREEKTLTDPSMIMLDILNKAGIERVDIDLRSFGVVQYMKIDGKLIPIENCYATEELIRGL